jgi:hypothetical protein
MLTWPRSLVVARTVEWQLVTPAQPPQASLGGVPQRSYLSGGPYWMLTLSGLVMRGRNAILAGRALQVALLGGAPILVRPCDCRQAPLAIGDSFAPDPASDGSPFDDAVAGEDNPIVATIGAAALRAVNLALTMVSGHRAIAGGEQFSVVHTNWGQRMYRLMDAAGAIRPPLREAAAGGTSVDFNRPGCVMRLEGDMSIESTIPGRLHTGRATFVELERSPTAGELA